MNPASSDLLQRLSRLESRPAHAGDDAAAYFEFGRDALQAGRADLTVRALQRLTQRPVGDPVIWRLLGFACREEQEMTEAVRAFVRSAAIDPTNEQTAFGHAQSCLDAGLPSIALFEHALRLSPGNPGALRNYATALASEGRADAAETLLVAALADHPDWLDGHRRLAALRWTAGDAQGFARSYEAACRAQPQNLALRMAWFRAIAQVRDWDAARAILDTGRRILGDSPALQVAELFVASESGDRARADALFLQTQDLHDEVRDLAFIRHSLRTGRADAAEPVASRLVGTRSAPLVWPYLSLIWRLGNDARAQWLDGSPPLVRVLDLPFAPGELETLAATLRGLHTANAPYVEQSVRGGTQTDGHVLLRHEPALQDARRRIRAAVRQYIDELPASVPGHPLLGTPREQILFEGSWSVRLKRQGFNVAHTHPMGWISSAFYVSLPSVAQLGSPPAGWIRFGTPPPELGLDLPPTHQVEPRPGRLALFPSTMWHATVPFDDGERLVLAFDVRVPRY